MFYPRTGAWSQPAPNHLFASLVTAPLWASERSAAPTDSLSLELF
jgi:hypothetical protein